LLDESRGFFSRWTKGRGYVHTISKSSFNFVFASQARVSLARAAYSVSDIVLLDDPLSAVDAFVGKSILENCLLQGPLADRTRVLVTHALYFLDKTDYIYVMDHGKIIEQGTYAVNAWAGTGMIWLKIFLLQKLMAVSAVFSRLIEEHGNPHAENQCGPIKLQVTSPRRGKVATDPIEHALMQEEERNTGAVEWNVYKKYLRSAGGLIWAPVIGALLLITQGNNSEFSAARISSSNQCLTVATTLFLGFWSGNTIHHFSQGEYMAVYAGLGKQPQNFPAFTQTDAVFRRCPGFVELYSDIRICVSEPL
jgi:hypothetical protein